MFVLLAAVPALLVVVLGYVVGYGLWNWFVGTAGAEAVGWTTGLLALAGVVRWSIRWWRERSRRP